MSKRKTADLSGALSFRVGKRLQLLKGREGVDACAHVTSAKACQLSYFRTNQSESPPLTGVRGNQSTVDFQLRAEGRLETLLLTKCKWASSAPAGSNMGCIADEESTTDVAKCASEEESNRRKEQRFWSGWLQAAGLSLGGATMLFVRRRKRHEPAERAEPRAKPARLPPRIWSSRVTWRVGARRGAEKRPEGDAPATVQGTILVSV